VGVVTLVATASAKTGDWVVLVDKWPGLVRMASYALALERGLANLRGLRRVHCMAIAAQELTFRYRMVIVQSELTYLGRMALSTKRHFVSLEEQLLLRLLCCVNQTSGIYSLSAFEGAGLEIEVRIWMHLVAGYAR